MGTGLRDSSHKYGCFIYPQVETHVNTSRWRKHSQKFHRRHPAVYPNHHSTTTTLSDLCLINSRTHTSLMPLMPLVQLFVVDMKTPGLKRSGNIFIRQTFGPPVIKAHDQERGVFRTLSFDAQLSNQPPITKKVCPLPPTIVTFPANPIDACTTRTHSSPPRLIPRWVDPSC